MSLFDKLRIPKRTHATNLTNDELILFDAMFETRVSFSILLRDTFCEVLNYPEEHRHSLDGEKLWRVLDTLICRGLLETYSRGYGDNQYTSYGLTPDGGRLWELERQPDWNLYCQAWSYEEHGPDGQEVTYCSVKSPTMEIAQAFWAVGLKAQLFHDLDLTHITIGPTQQEISLIYWRPKFEPLYEIRAPQLPDYDPDGYWPNWEVYEQNRVWWRGLMELGGLFEK